MLILVRFLVTGVYSKYQIFLPDGLINKPVRRHRAAILRLLRLGGSDLGIG
jgi:hypothetical protein